MKKIVLSVNDTFNTKEEAQEVMESYAMDKKFNYNIITDNKSVALVCKGAIEFGCEARITAALRKKDDKYVLKKLKLTHKCPSVSNKYESTAEFIRAELSKSFDGQNIRIGEAVAQLASANIKVGYFAVWKSLRKGSTYSEEKENIAADDEITKRLKLDHTDQDDMEMALEELSEEFSRLNPTALSHSKDKMICFIFPHTLKALVPVIELRIYKKTEGYAIFGVLHDPVDSPIVYAFVISEQPDRSAAIKYFLASISKNIVLIDFDFELINILEEQKMEYFIKTREICKFYYNKTRSNTDVEAVWKKCTLDLPYETPELDAIDKSRYIKKYCGTEMLGLQATSECDLDFIPLSVFQMTIFDATTAILKLISDNLKLRKKINISDKKSLFGNNVVLRLEKNMSIKNVDQSFIVNLDNSTCTCGWFQELLIPCPHACKVIKESGGDPYSHVGGMYAKTRLLELSDVVPVINLPVKCQSDRNLLKRGPGRPKKEKI